MVHTRRSQIVVQLISPPRVAGDDTTRTIVPLTVGTGGDGSAYDTFAYDNAVFDYLSGQPLSAGANRYQGLYRPAGDLSLLNGLRITAGRRQWFLRIVENRNTDNQFGQHRAERTLGYLRGWSRHASSRARSPRWPTRR